jgi:4-hydroxyphenylacetate 3-monooxygenase
MAGTAKPKSAKPTAAPSRAAAKSPTLPYTGKEFLESLDDGREVWIYGERVKNITDASRVPELRAHDRAPLRRAARGPQSGKNVLTEPTEWGGFTHRYFRAPTTVEEQVAGRDAIARWARSTTAGSAARPTTRRRSSHARRQRRVLRALSGERAPLVSVRQERVPFINHAIIHPPVDRNIAPGAPGGPTDVFARVTKETGAGIYVSGARSWRPGRR